MADPALEPTVNGAEAANVDVEMKEENMVDEVWHSFRPMRPYINT